MKKSNLEFIKSFRKLIDRDLERAFAGKSPGEVEVFKHAFYYDLFGRFATPFNDYNKEFLERTEDYRQLAREKLRMGQDEFRDTFCTYGAYSPLCIVNSIKKNKDYYTIDAYEIILGENIKIYSPFEIKEEDLGEVVFIRVAELDGKYYFVDSYMPLPEFNMTKFIVYNSDLIAMARGSEEERRNYLNPVFLQNVRMPEIFSKLLSVNTDLTNIMFMSLHQECPEIANSVMIALDEEEIEEEDFAIFLKVIIDYRESYNNYKKLPDYIKSVCAKGMMLNTYALEDFVRFISTFLEEEGERKIAKKVRDNLFIYKNILSNSKLGLLSDFDLQLRLFELKIYPRDLADLMLQICWEIKSSGYLLRKDKMTLTQGGENTIITTFLELTYGGNFHKEDLKPFRMSYNLAYGTLLKRGFITEDPVPERFAEMTADSEFFESITKSEMNTMLIENILDKETLSELIGPVKARSLYKNLKLLREGEDVLTDEQRFLLEFVGLLEIEKVEGFDQFYDEYLKEKKESNIIDIKTKRRK